ncbi:Histidine biosynthesis bifunctional protein HisB [subsurface metagenome]
MRRAVFLDRDGVLNAPLVIDGRPYPPKSREELVILPGAAGACKRLREAGFLLIMVTNQPDVARGIQTKENVQLINKILADQLSLDAFYVCYHDDRDRCECRKPKPGMLLEAARDWRINLSKSFMVGDRWRDVEAGLRAGCQTIFIDYGYKEELQNKPQKSLRSLAATARYILKRCPGSNK